MCTGAEKVVGYSPLSLSLHLIPLRQGLPLSPELTVFHSVAFALPAGVTDAFSHSWLYMGAET